jgi:hypothetical protein
LSQARAIKAINLGGEGEEPAIINQQRPAALSAQWASCVLGVSLEELAAQGNDFLICPNTTLPIADDSIDLVVTNSVAIDRVIFGEPTVQSSEIKRILATNGQWKHDTKLRYTKP